MPVHKAEALFSFQPTASVELELKKGDVVLVRRMSVGEGWWEGELNGKRGLFPSSYVKLLPPGSPPDRPKTPLTPRTSKKAFMETLLTPAYNTQEEIYDAEKAMELFVPLHSEINIMVGPRWDCHPPTLTITIKELPIEKTRFSGLKQYTMYDVETKELSSCVTRKYKQFLWLYDRLAEGFPCVSLPPLPVKQFSGSSGPESIEARRRALERFLFRVANHPVLGSTKLFRDFLTMKDDKDWKIGRHMTHWKFSKSSKKLFQAPVYYIVKYPPHNVPLNQLASIEKFSRFSRLLEMNVNTLQQSYLQFSMAHSDNMSCVNLLGRDFERFSKGLQPTTGVQRRKLQAAASLNVNLANGQSAFYTTTPQRSAAELEEDSSGDESDCGAWNWREDDRFSAMVRDLHDTATGMRKMTSVYQHHQEVLEQQVLNTLQEYSGIIHTLPVLVKLHEEAMETYNSSKEKDSKKEAEEVRQNCETLNNVLLAEFDYFSRVMVDDFENMMARFLQQQANFHRHMAEEWESLHSKYTERVSKHRESSRHFPATLLKSKSTTLSATSSHGSASSLSHGRDFESVDSRDRSESDSTASLSHSGGPTPQPRSRPHSRPTPPPNYINIDLVSGKPAANETKASEYETPSVCVKKEGVVEKEEEEEEEEEEDKERKGEELRPPYANWQFLSLQPNNISKPVAGVGGLQKKPMPLQRKSPGSTDLNLAPSTVPSKPLTPPKPKDLQLPSKRSPTPLSAPQATSLRPVSEIIPMRMPANPAHSFGGNKKRSETSHDGLDRTTDNAKAKGAMREDNSLQPLAKTKPRSYTTSNVDKKQPLLPPAKGRYGSTWVSSKPPQQIPEEQDSDTPISPVQEKEEETSSLEASQESTDPSSLDSTKLMTKTSKSSATAVTATSTVVTATSTAVTATSTAVTATPTAVTVPSSPSSAAKGSSTGGENELMRKLSIRRQRLEQQLQGSSDKPIPAVPQSTSTISERSSEECSHDSTSSTQSELVLAYRRTDDSPLNSTANGDGSVALRKPDSEKDGNLAKYGIIEDVNGGSFVI